MSPFFKDNNYQDSKWYSYFIAALIGAIVGGLLVAFLVPGLRANREHKELETKTPAQNVEDSAKNKGTNEASKNRSVVEVVKQVGPAVVKITTVEDKLIPDFLYGRRKERIKGEGSGVIFSKKGYILTNNHVVEGADRIKVVLTGTEQEQREFTGKVVGRDPITDLAVVKIEGEELPVAKLGDSEELQVGQLVIAIGNPFGFSNTVTTGVISAVGRKLEIQKGTELTDMIQTDAAINPGNSGGALLNKDGKVIGINTVIIQGAQGLGFAIPINTVREISKELIEKGKVIRPWLGIYGVTIDPGLAKEYDLPREEGIFIAKVVNGSPADRHGLRKGDLITEIDGVKVNTMGQLLKRLKELEVGQTIKIALYREGKLKVVEVKLGSRPGPGEKR